ncbi:hypothetical protein AN1V17_23770 [Vallitalea sediminicola]
MQAIIIEEKKNCNYKLMVDQIKKTLRCIASGYFSLESATAYIEELLQVVSTIQDIENYTLIVDAKKQEKVAQEVLPTISV